MTSINLSIIKHLFKGIFFSFFLLCSIHTNTIAQSEFEYQDIINRNLDKLNIQREKGDKEGAMKSSYVISTYYVNYLMDYNKGTKYTLNTHTIASEIGNKKYQILSLQQMAFIHYSWGEIDNALAHYREALKIAESINDEKSILNLSISLGDILREEYRIKEAIIYYEKLLINKNSPEISPAAVFTLGNYYKLIDKPDSTLYYFQTSIKLFQKDSNYRWESYIHSQLALELLSNGETEDAFLNAEKGLAIANNHNCKKEKYDNFLSLSKIYESQLDFKNSLIYFKLYSDLKDSIYGAKTNQNVEYLQLKLQLETEEKEVNKLINEKKLNQIEITNKKYAIYIVIGGFILLLAILAIIYFRLMVIKKQKLEIEKSYQNEVNLVTEKETLLKEVHHRVKNNMQIISSLLSLQQSSQKDEKIIDLFEQSKYRIQAMAMVHEMLYQKKNMGLINYEGYLNRLGHSLITALKVGECEVELKINAPEIELNIDTAIPLGLIINEILTNSIKYGFKDKLSGSIYVSLENVGNKKLILKIGDNGIGFDFKKEIDSSESLGLQLIETLSEQLNGKVEMLSNEGTNYLIAFEEQ